METTDREVLWETAISSCLSKITELAGCNAFSKETAQEIWMLTNAAAKLSCAAHLTAKQKTPNQQR